MNLPDSARIADLAIAAARMRTVTTSDPRRDRYARRLARVIGSTLWVEPERITVTDDPDRIYGGWPSFLITITDTDGTTFRFATDPGCDDEWLLLRPCPGCEAMTPRHRVRTAADLGDYLMNPALPPVPEFATDPAHHTGCTHAQPDRS